MEANFAISFDIDNLGGGAYGMKAWAAVWRNCNVSKAIGAKLYEGDSSATLQGLENVYLCAFYGLQKEVQSEFENAMSNSGESGYLRCLKEDDLIGEPLRACGIVTETAKDKTEIDQSTGQGWASSGLATAQEDSKP